MSVVITLRAELVAVASELTRHLKANIIAKDQTARHHQKKKKRDSRNGFFTVLTPGETVSKLRVCEFMQAAGRSNTEVTPNVFTAAEVQLLDGARTGFEPL